MQAPNEGHFPVNTIEQALGTINDAPAPTLGELSDAVSNALQAQSRHASGSNGDGTTSFTLDTASTVTVAPGFTGTGSVAQPVPNTIIDAGATLELTHAYSGTISFAGATGTLIIDHSSSFSGTITGQLAIGNVIDLADITGGANVTIAYSGNNSPGTLTVSDGTHTANIALTGNYSLANFTAFSDGHGGTSIIDPPVLPSGVTLKPIDGGPTYYADHGFTNAVNMGWDRSKFLPDWPMVFQRITVKPMSIHGLLLAGTPIWPTGMSTFRSPQSHGISVIEQNYSGSLPVKCRRAYLAGRTEHIRTGRLWSAQQHGKQRSGRTFLVDEQHLELDRRTGF